MSAGLPYLRQQSVTTPDHAQSPTALQTRTCRPRARLSEEQVIQIFCCRNEQKSPTIVSRLYGVNEKTVRDIWSGRTWSKKTRYLDASNWLSGLRTPRPIGTKSGCDSSYYHPQEQQPSAEVSLMRPEASMYDEASVPFALNDHSIQVTESIDDLLYQWDLNDCWMDAIIQVLRKTS
jgi:hypothetical protein